MVHKEVGIGLIGYVIGKVHTHAWLGFLNFPRIHAIYPRDSLLFVDGILQM